MTIFLGLDIFSNIFFLCIIYLFFSTELIFIFLRSEWVDADEPWVLSWLECLLDLKNSARTPRNASPINGRFCTWLIGTQRRMLLVNDITLAHLEIIIIIHLRSMKLIINLDFQSTSPLCFITDHVLVPLEKIPTIL